MNYPTYGRTLMLTAAGSASVCATSCHIIGVLVANTGTGAISIHHSAIASGATTIAYVRGNATTTAAGLYFPCPAYASGGLSVIVEPANDPNITLFWNPST
jgi:hypothetical protein